MVLINEKHKLKSLYRILSIYHKLDYNDFSQHLEKAFPNLYFLEALKILLKQTLLKNMTIDLLCYTAPFIPQRFCSY